MLILSNDEIQQVLKMKDCVDAMEAAFHDLSLGKGVNRPRSHTYVPMPGETNEDRFYMFKSMDGALPRFGMHGLRISSDMLSERYVEGKRRREKLPVAPGGKYMGLLVLFSLESLEPLAMMPDGYLQRVRVGATSAVAAKFLAKKEINRVGLIGTGWQAGAQVMGLHEIFSGVKEIKVYSVQENHRKAFAEEWSGKLGVNFRAVDSPREAAEDVEILALATNSQTPVIDGDWVPEGCHVNSVQGAELDDKIVERAEVIGVREVSEPTFWVMGDGLPYEVSSQKSMKKGDLDPRKVRQLGDIISGKVEGRVHERQITLFTGSGTGGSAGLGTQFVAVGAMIYKRAKESGMGKEIPTEWFLQEFRP
jgi:ornithine cyclodeaminase/alanine dehydrogenase-like protein (mu-crystallin family)